jgi:hypothetical protein
MKVKIKMTYKENLKHFLVPNTVVGIGGYGKLVLPRLDALYNQYYGYRPGPANLVTFDFDGSNGEFRSGDSIFSTAPYLNSLPKKPLEDLSKILKKDNAEELAPWIKAFYGYVDFDHVNYVEGPGLNLFMQSANLAWRLVWETHILPALKINLKNLHPAPQALNRLEREEGFKISKRSIIFVVAGGGSTTGPSGLIPILSELKSLKPVDSSLFALIFTPRSYRDKTEKHREKGRAIFNGTMMSLISLFNGKGFDDQPFGKDGRYRIKLVGHPCDHIFLVDGTLSGGRVEMDNDQIGNIVANLIFKLTTSPLGENALGILGNLNSGLYNKEEEKWNQQSSDISLVSN